MKKIIGVVIVIVIIVLIITMSGGKQGETGPIRIGSIVPLTGDAASYGEPMRNAMQLATKEINEKGGISGRILEIIFEDGKCTGSGAASAAQKLINVDLVEVIIGGMCSGETLSAAPIAEESKTVLFSPGSGSPDITKAGDFVFRNFPSDASSGSKVAQYAFDHGIKKVGIIAESTDYAQAVKGVFVDKFKAIGGEIVADESFKSDTADFRTHLSKIKAAGPQALYLLPQTPQKAIIILNQFKQSGLKVQLLTNEFANTSEVLKGAPDAIEGAIYAEPAFDESRSVTKMFLDKYKSVYGEAGAGLPPVYLATGYDAVYIIKEMIEQSGYDAAKIKANLYNIKNREGAAGNLTIDMNGDPLFEYVVKTIKDNKPVIVE